VSSESSPVTVFWRPGCPYCWRLRTKLKHAGIDVDEINIWENPDGAAFVRSVTGGDETVPTVRVGTKSFVNPSPGEVLEVIRDVRG
jgi:glutaredoxin-like protein